MYLGPFGKQVLHGRSFNLTVPLTHFIWQFAAEMHNSIVLPWTIHLIH
jgi:hypothetical protein